MLPPRNIRVAITIMSAAKSNMSSAGETRCVSCAPGKRADDAGQAKKRGGFCVHKTGARIHECRGEARSADNRERHADGLLRRHMRGINQHRQSNDRSTAAEHG